MKNRLNARWLGGLAATAALVLTTATGSWAQAEPDQTEQTLLAAKGRITYRIYCSNCHGDQGTGDGQLAEILKVPPSDLTILRRENGGTFPTERLHEVIDGRRELKGHGTREMPIWGEAFQKTLQRTWKEVTDEERAQYKIEEVVAFLESIQAEEPE